MAASSFTGEERAKIDGKGRMSIPAKFREVLQAGDADRAEGAPVSLQLNYGDHLGHRLEVRTVQTHESIAARLAAWEPVSEEEAEAKESAEYFLLTQSMSLELGDDGRIVLPARFREKLGFDSGEVVFAGKSDRFEIWAAETYETEVVAKHRTFLGRQAAGYNPMTALARARKG